MTGEQAATIMGLVNRIVEKECAVGELRLKANLKERALMDLRDELINLLEALKKEGSK